MSCPHKYVQRRSFLLPLFITLLFYFCTAEVQAALTFTREATFDDAGPTSNAFGFFQEVGDFNGDGYEDVFAPQTSAGTTYIYLGSATANDTADISLTNDGGTFYPGHAWGDFGVADIDDDGYDDLLLPTDITNKEISIFWGNASPGATLEESDGASITAPTSYLRFTPIAGDFNADGDLDIAVAGTSNTAAAIYIFLGNGTKSIDTTVDATFTLSSALWAGAFQYGAFASGDVNNDGADDLIISDSTISGNKTRLFYGSSNLSDKSSADLEFIDVDTSVRLTRNVSFGDINNDGTTDFCMGAYISDTVETDAGRLYCFYGGDDLNTPTSKDPIETYADFKLPTSGNVATGDNFGRSVKIYDVNNDGYNDIIVGVVQTTAGGDGKVEIYLGSSSGVATTASATITAPETGLGFGNSIEVLDHDNDDYIELSIGTAAGGTGGSNTGKIYLYKLTSGSPSPGSPTITDTATTGTASSSTSLSGVEWSTATTLPGSWTSCTASDGSFDSTSEAYSCDVSSASAGSIIYVRTLDSNSLYLTGTAYGSAAFTGSTSGRDFTLSIKNGSLQDEASTHENVVLFKWHQSSSVSEYKVYTRKRHGNTWDEKSLSADSDSYTKYFEEGEYEWKVRAVHTDGNTTDTPVYTFTIDSTVDYDVTVEEINYSSVVDNAVYISSSSTIKVEGSAESDSVVRVSIWDGSKSHRFQVIECDANVSLSDGLSAYTCESSAEINPTTYTISVESEDAAGNTSEIYDIELLVS